MELYLKLMLGINVQSSAIQRTLCPVIHGILYSIHAIRSSVYSTHTHSDLSCQIDPGTISLLGLNPQSYITRYYISYNPLDIYSSFT